MSVSKQLRRFAIATSAIGALLCGAVPASALNMTYGDVEVRNLGSYGFTANDSFLSLDNGQDQLYQMFGYLGNAQGTVRVNASHFDEASAIAQTAPDTAMSSIVLDNRGANELGLNRGEVEIDYIFTLKDDAVIPDGKGLGFEWDITIRNLSSTNLSLVFYSYLDLDLDGDFGDDSAVADLTQMVITDQGSSTTYVWNTSNGGPADHFQVGQYPSVRDTLEGMVGGPAQDLSDNLPNFGPSDFTGAYQYDLTIGAGGSFNLSGSSVQVPEPATAFLTMLGLLGLSVEGRRRRAC